MTEREPMPAWRKSSYSQGLGSDCVEVAWRKSSYSDGSVSSDCVEVAFGSGTWVRDSKNILGPVLGFGADAWREFVQQAPVGGEGAEHQ
jgi:hypothetical protein